MTVNYIGSHDSSVPGLTSVWTSHAARKGASKALHHSSVFPSYIYQKANFISTLHSPSDLISHSCRMRLWHFGWCTGVYTRHYLFLDMLQGGAPQVSLLEFFPSTEQFFLDQTCTMLPPQPTVLRWRHLNTPTVLCLYWPFIAHNTAIYG